MQHSIEFNYLNFIIPKIPHNSRRVVHIVLLFHSLQPELKDAIQIENDHEM